MGYLKFQVVYDRRKIIQRDSQVLGQTEVAQQTFLCLNGPADNIVKNDIPRGTVVNGKADDLALMSPALGSLVTAHMARRFLGLHLGLLLRFKLLFGVMTPERLPGIQERS